MSCLIQLRSLCNATRQASTRFTENECPTISRYPYLGQPPKGEQTQPVPAGKVDLIPVGRKMTKRYMAKLQ